MLTSRFDAVLFLFLHHRFFDFFKMFVGKVKVGGKEDEPSFDEIEVRVVFVETLIVVELEHVI